MYHWRVGLAYCIQKLKTVSCENGFVKYDFQQLTLILGFCAPKKMVTMNSFPKTIASLNSYRNAIITNTLNLLTSWILHILYNISHWQLWILAPPSDFSARKRIVTGGPLPPCPPPPPGHHATGKEWWANINIVGTHGFCLRNQSSAFFHYHSKHCSGIMASNLWIIKWCSLTSLPISWLFITGKCLPTYSWKYSKCALTCYL